MAPDLAPTWNGIPEVVAHGSPFEIGLHHGRQIPNRIAVCIANYKRVFRETAHADWAESQRRASAYLPSLEHHEADLIEEMRGIAVGAQVEFLEILALNLRNEIALTNFSDGCTSIAKQDRNTGTVFAAQNWDWVSEMKSCTAFFDLSKTGMPRVRFLGEAGLIGKFGFNEAGLGACFNAIRSNVADISRLPVHLAERRVLECRSLEEALEMLQRKGVASCFSATVADRSGDMANVECTPKGLVVMTPESMQRIVCHTNHLWSKRIPDDIRDFPAQNSFLRLDRIMELSKGDEASFDSIRSWLADEYGSPDSICRKPAPLFAGGVLGSTETLATVIFDLTNLKAQISVGLPSESPRIRDLSL